MTEYDYSPEAFEAYLHKQQQIARWVDKTNRFPPKNPFTPATPAVQALALDRSLDSDDEHDSDYRRRHPRRENRDPRDRDRELRDRERSTRGHSERDSSRPRPNRHRSASHSAAPHRSDHSRAFSVPPPLPIPPLPSPTNSYPPHQHYPYPPKLTSPRDSRHSSRTSSTQVPSPTSYTFGQQVPYSAPQYRPMGGPVRSQTLPNYVYPQDSKYAYPAPYYPNGPSPVYPPSSIKPVDLANAPQYPHSMYQTKQPPLLKRIFGGFLKSNKQPQPQRRSRHHRTSSF